AGYLAANATQVFGLAAVGVLIAHNRFLAANGTLTAHDFDLLQAGILPISEVCNIAERHNTARQRWPLTPSKYETLTPAELLPDGHFGLQPGHAGRCASITGRHSGPGHGSGLTAPSASPAGGPETQL